MLKNGRPSDSAKIQNSSLIDIYKQRIGECVSK
jgi:hypothetical protein